ncbi:hypothetical protein LPJ78_002946 [Coemansia sp. RSA 989]|nr:ketopantoate reductase PanE/ApbA-domain-containing protein [Coemansia mojavensis]KAJ1741883.1 hypothetical protein LPJ68_002434 [Coemansia sp. RSA 1086]KAJ1750452.1 hypothetical protein LPJ79_002878 [Coemansia sp. RSA 1821]KAJ1865055.1 hypothetical protein LPJ78_002946 [Coemansia sp. RSA 989]KAJ2652720.1 hypothetical protein IWW40_000831 [Coemansia sp. RSA 1250]KAJ2675327.1 hypothetical protein IWW42_001111 [Coemansia sp. RSA 1085]
MPTNVLLVGAGALGSIYAWRLQEGGVHVTCVCRSNYSTVQSQGFSISSEAYGQHTYHPSRVVTSVDEAVADGKVYDFIIFCTKALPNLSDNSHIIAPAVSQNTIIMLIQNGIGIEEPFAERYPETPLVSVIAYIDVSQPQSGSIEHGNVSALVMGLHNPAQATADVQDRVERLSNAWNQNGVMCMVVEHIQSFRWLKLVWNASFNTVSVVSGGNNTREMLADPRCKQLIRSIMEEVYAIGEAATGAPLPVIQGKDSPDAFIEDTENRQVPVEPSMLMDFRAKRPMEHDVILRRPLEVARKLGINAPYMEAVYAMLVMVEKTLVKL